MPEALIIYVILEPQNHEEHEEHEEKDFVFFSVQKHKVLDCTAKCVIWHPAPCVPKGNLPR